MMLIKVFIIMGIIGIIGIVYALKTSDFKDKHRN